ncbi:MAG: methyltransferase domain-containing protein [Candidatus Woesearchaeota archaeon]
MGRSSLEHLVEQLQQAPTLFTSHPQDMHQCNPLSRIQSIAVLLSSFSFPSNAGEFPFQSPLILDIGTGYGYGAVVLHTLGYTVLGVELNKKKLEEGLHYWSKQGIDFSVSSDPASLSLRPGTLSFLYADATSLPSSYHQRFDAATSFYVSRYMLKPSGVLFAAHQYLKSKGTLLITTEGPKHLPSWLRHAVVMFLSTTLHLPSLHLENSTVVYHPFVYDRYVFLYKKTEK